MSVSSVGASFCPSCVSQSPALTFNHQKAVDVINNKTGMDYSIDVEKSAGNAQMILNLMV